MKENMASAVEKDDSEEKTDSDADNIVDDSDKFVDTLLEDMLVSTDNLGTCNQVILSDYSQGTSVPNNLNDSTHHSSTEAGTQQKESDADTVNECISQLRLESEDNTAVSGQQQEEEITNNSDWQAQEKHVFILSSAGKPIYSRHGSEDKLVTLFGVMQALVSFVGDDEDTIHSIHTHGSLFVFLIKGPIILACVSKTRESVSQLTVQLEYVYSQIISVLTLEQLTRIYEQRRNYDLRRLLAGAERLVDHLLYALETQPALLLGAVQCLPLTVTTRDAITNIIITSCSKIEDLVFAILLGGNQLITLIRMKTFFLHPADLHLILNLVNSSESFKTAESWTPICLPKFNSRGFLHAHVSYLAEDCQACLLLLSVDPDLFFSLSEAKQKIVEKLRRASLLQSINEALSHPSTPGSPLNVPDVRHFLYKCKATAQFWGPLAGPPYHTPEGAKRLLNQYRVLHDKLHSPPQPLKLIYIQDHAETMLGWVTTGFELYVAFEPLVTKSTAINSVNKILRWLKKDENGIFINNAPTF